MNWVSKVICKKILLEENNFKRYLCLAHQSGNRLKKQEMILDNNLFANKNYMTNTIRSIVSGKWIREKNLLLEYFILFYTSVIFKRTLHPRV